MQAFLIETIFKTSLMPSGLLASGCCWLLLARSVTHHAAHGVH